jgi:hypothetical protein
MAASAEQPSLIAMEIGTATGLRYVVVDSSEAAEAVPGGIPQLKRDPMIARSPSRGN